MYLSVALIGTVFILLGSTILYAGLRRLQDDDGDDGTEIRRVPRLDWVDLVGGLLVYFGFLAYLTTFHLIAINEADADVRAVMGTVFSVFLYLYVVAVVFGFVGVVIQFFRWLTYMATTPKWLRMKGGDKFGR